LTPLQAEASRRLKHAPIAFYAQPPKGLFEAGSCANDFAGWDLSV